MLATIIKILVVGFCIELAVCTLKSFRYRLRYNNLSARPLTTLPVSKIKFCQLVFEWCQNNISNPGNRKPTLVLRYYSHSKWRGLYKTKSHECIVYIHKDVSIGQVVNVVIHEFVHARQSTKTFNKMYDQYNQQFGYDKNPFEIEARNVAKQYENECLMWVLTQIKNQ